MSTTIITPLKALDTTETNRNPAAVYLARLAPGSRRAMHGALEALARLVSPGAAASALPWPALRYEHTQALRAKVVATYAPRTANRHLAALRGVLREAWRLGLLSAEDYHRATDLPSVRVETLPAGREVDAGELRALFQACDASPIGARDAALLTLLYGAGLRRAEAVALQLEDFNPKDGALKVRAGKGRKERMVYATNGGLSALKAWLEVRGSAPGPLLCPVAKGGRVVLAGMTGTAVHQRLQALGKKAGVDTFSPHDLRRTFISRLLDSGADLSTVQRLAGHANVATTQAYDRRGEVTKRKAAELLHVPYVRR